MPVEVSHADIRGQMENADNMHSSGAEAATLQCDKASSWGHNEHDVGAIVEGA